MKRLIFAALALACLASPADVSSLMLEAQRFMAENNWSETNLFEAVRSVRQLYLNDTKSATGRARWHGRLVRKVTDTVNRKYISTYADGTVFEDAMWSNSVRSATAKSASVTSSGLPAKLAAARANAAAKAATTNVVTITAGGSK